ncbi:MAG: type II secretion system protein J [Elusimicrobiota bacterium]
MSLLELMLAVSLGTVVLATGLSVLSMGVSNQVYATRQARLQGDAFLAWRAVEVELRGSTAILSPGGAGAQSDVLMGCGNFDAKLGVLNPAAPVTGFMFCESGGNVYFYRFSPASCPMATLPTCGSGGTVVAGGVSHLAAVPAYFSRPVPGLVRFAYQTVVAGQSQPVDSSVAINAAAGTNQ